MARYVLPSEPENVEVFLRRTQLLEVLQSRAPKTFARLDERVWPAYQRLLGQSAVPFDGPVIDLVDVKNFVDWFRDRVAAADPLVEELNTEIARWMEDYHLTADWMLDAVLSLMCGWKLHPECVEPYTYGPLVPPMTGGAPFAVEAPVVQISTWDPRFESRGVARKRILATAAAEADAYLDGVETATKAAGYQETKMRLETAHAEDFVEFQVKRKSCAVIAREREDAVTEKAVEKRVMRTAKAIGLTLRPAAR